MHLSEDNIERFDEDVENTYANKSQTNASTERGNGRHTVYQSDVDVPKCDNGFPESQKERPNECHLYNFPHSHVFSFNLSQRLEARISSEPTDTIRTAVQESRI